MPAEPLPASDAPVPAHKDGTTDPHTNRLTKSADLFAVVQDRERSPTERNNAANELLNHRDTRLASQLVRMTRDETDTVAWRNYCVQFLRGCYDQQPDPEVLGTIYWACKVREPEISSCAIWSLAQLAKPSLDPTRLSEVERNRCRDIALAALNDESAHFLVRTAGAQSCARIGTKEALPALRKLVQSEIGELSLRVVAIAALGGLKDAESIPILKDLELSKNPRLAKAAQGALKAIGE